MAGNSDLNKVCLQDENGEIVQVLGRVEDQSQSPTEAVGEVVGDILPKDGATILGKLKPDFSIEFIYLFGVLRHFQHCRGHITTGSWKGRGNQYIEFVRDLYCKLPTNGKQLPAFPLEAMMGIEPQPQRWEARVLPLCHRGPRLLY